MGIDLAAAKAVCEKLRLQHDTHGTGGGYNKCGLQMLVAALAEIESLERERDAAHDALRSLACYLGVGGYNADTVDAAVFEKKIRDGIDMQVDMLQRERDELRKAILSFGAGNDFDWKVLGRIDELERERDELRAKVAELQGVLDAINNPAGVP